MNKGERKSTRRILSGVLLIVLLASMLYSTFNILPVIAQGTIHIRADGSIEPPDAPISTVDNVTYTFIGNIDALFVERDNIVVDGAGYTVHGGSGTGMDLSGRSNVTIQKTNIEGSECGIYLSVSSNNRITENNITTDIFDRSIVLSDSSHNSITGNKIITNDADGVSFYSSDYNSILENLIIGTQGSLCVMLDSSSGNDISGNSMSGGGISLSSSSNNNTVSGNNLNPGGVGLSKSSYNVVSENNITNNAGYSGLVLGGSSNVVSNNSITGNRVGIMLENYDRVSIPYGYEYVVVCYNNKISGNNITNNDWGIGGGDGDGVFSYNNTYFENTIADNGNDGINFYHAENNTLWGNTIADNGGAGVGLTASENTFYHNNFIDNTLQVETSGDVNIWDDGYPSGGNYWSDQVGTDMYSGPNQDMPGSDGIGDASYIIDQSNQDNYPLMSPWTPPDLAVLNITASKTVVAQGRPLSITVTSTNPGSKVENLSVQLYANATCIEHREFILVNGTSIVFWLFWDTTNCSRAYVISANVTPLEGEIRLDDNVFTFGIVKVSCVGDINGDYVTDAKDFVLVKKAIPSMPSSPNWNANANMNDDGVIDAKDYQIVKTHIPSIFP